VTSPPVRHPEFTDLNWESFAALQYLHNHWDRPDWPPGRTAYYWYLCFNEEPEIRALAARCQSAVAGPHLDLVDLNDLHMTLESIAFSDEINTAGLRAVRRLARQRLANVNSFEIVVGPLSGSSGALSFSVSPHAKLDRLRSGLLQASQEAGYAVDRSRSRPFRPHIGIGYCNRTIEARKIVEQVRALRRLPRVTVQAGEVALVSLTRNERSYSWTVVDRLRLQKPPLRH